MSLETVADPVLKPGDMLLRMSAAAICGTDIRVYRGRKIKGVRRPSVLGHEFAGVIVETGGHAGFAPATMSPYARLCPAANAANVAWGPRTSASA